MAGSNSISKTFIWILMGLLILGLGGFGVTNLTGTVHRVASVGETNVGANDYARALRQEIRAQEAEAGGAISISRAQEMGLDRNVLGRLITRAALEEETRRIGVSIGDANLREEILQMDQFDGLDGEFDREGYAYALQQAGLSESEFEENLRAETASNLLQSSVISGVRAAPAYIDTLITYLAERRSISWAILDREDLAGGLPVPSEADMRRYHEENEADFTTPETRDITYAWLTPEMILDSVQIDEEVLREAYEERADEFRQPERRLVERLVFGNETTAETARERIESGEITFEDLVNERGLDLPDVDMGDVTRDQLGTAADAVFATETGDIVGPLPTDLGPALFRVNAALEAQETTFEDARPRLRDELANDRARRIIQSRINDVDDLLAGGATIEDLARETDLELGEISWHDGMSEGIAAYPAFRDAAASVEQGDYPEVLEFEDDGIFALRLDGIGAPEVQPLDTVRDEVMRRWQADKTVEALRDQVRGQLPRLREGATFEELGLTRTHSAEDLTRRGFQDDTPPEFIETVFSMDEGEVTLLDGDGRLFVLRLDAIRAPSDEDEDVANLRNVLRNQAASSLGQDYFQVLADDIRQRAGVSVDQQALNAVHSNLR